MRPFTDPFPWKIRLRTLILLVLGAGLITWVAWKGIASRRPSATSSSIASGRRAAQLEADSPHTADARNRDDDVLVGEVASLLESIFRAAVGSDAGPRDQLSVLLATDLRGEPLRPARLERIYRDDCILVQRFVRTPAPTTATPSTSNTSAEELMAWIASLRPVLGPAGNWRPRIQVVRAANDDRGVTSDVDVRFAVKTPERRAEVRSRWSCDWHVAGNRWQLARLRVLEYEEAIARYAARDWFAECTPSVLGHNPSYESQLAHGLDHWLARIERVHQIDRSAEYGVAVGDANGDGLDDLYLCQPGGLPNRLFLQNLDGTATDVSLRSKADWLDNSSSALLVDFDNDGDQDLVVASESGVIFAANDGAARFEAVETLPSGLARPRSLSASDYDNDGDLDLLVCLTKRPAPRDQIPAVPGNQARDGSRQSVIRLFRNETGMGGKSRWMDVTDETELPMDVRSGTTAAAWEDFDDDGDQDLFVACVDGPGRVFRNDSGHLRDVTDRLDGMRAGGSHAHWLDVDRDGHIDLFVGAEFSRAGLAEHARPWPAPHVTGQADESSVNRRVWAFRQGSFAAVATLVDHQPLSRTSHWFDVNNDGWQDLIAAAPDEGFWLNLGRWQFAGASIMSPLDVPDDGCALAATDWDQDGDVDFWVANRSGPQARFLRNETPTNQRSVSLRLEGRTVNRDAIGARVDVTVPDAAALSRTVQAGGGYLSQSTKWLHFGLGRAARIERVDVRWPNGERESFRGLEPDGHYRLVQGTGRADLVPTGERPIVIHPCASSPGSVAASPAPVPDGLAMAMPVHDQRSGSSSDMPVHVLLTSPARLPDLAYTTASGNRQPIGLAGENVRLVGLIHRAAREVNEGSTDGSERLDAVDAWLSEMAARSTELEEFGVEVLVLSVSGQATPLSLPSEVRANDGQVLRLVAGHADSDLVEALVRVIGQHFDLDIPAPLDDASIDSLHARREDPLRASGGRKAMSDNVRADALSDSQPDLAMIDRWDRHVSTDALKPEDRHLAEPSLNGEDRQLQERDMHAGDSDLHRLNGDRHRGAEESRPGGGDRHWADGDRHRVRGTCLSRPEGVLIDRHGRLSAVYGTFPPVDRLLSDVAKCDLDDVQRRAAALPFAGRWAPPPLTPPPATTPRPSASPRPTAPSRPSASRPSASRPSASRPSASRPSASRPSAPPRLSASPPPTTASPRRSTALPTTTEPPPRPSEPAPPLAGPARLAAGSASPLAASPPMRLTRPTPSSTRSSEPSSPASGSSSRPSGSSPTRSKNRGAGTGANPSL